MLIDLFLSDLVAGYRQIRNARQALLAKWRLDLLRAYSAKWELHAEKLARQAARRDQFQRALPFLGGALVLVCGAGAWMVQSSRELTCLGMFFMLGTGFGALAALGGWLALTNPPKPPENPVTYTRELSESPLRQRLFPEMLPLWQREMAVEIPGPEEAQQMSQQSGEWGLTGEFALIRALADVASDDTYILHSLRVRSNEVMDVVVLGPKGFWYFEVRHWNADFIWRQGVWEVWQYDHESGGYDRPADLREYPDAEWRRLRDEALANLRAATGELLTKRPGLARVKGGLVFSNPNALVDIPKNAPFAHGSIEEWAATYDEAPPLKEWTPGRTLQLLEVLLKRHQSFYPNVELRSMKDSVQTVIEGVEEGLREWMET